MKRRPDRHVLAVLPATSYLLLLFVLPLVLLMAETLTDGADPLHAYARIVSAPVYRHVMQTTLLIGFDVTIIVLLLAYPTAYLISTLPTRLTALVLGLVALPWFTSLMVRSLAWMVLLGQHGVLNEAMLALGIIASPLPLLYSSFGLHVAMVHVLLPYMILALYSAMHRIDPRLLQAAQAQGAPPWRVFLHVFLPLSLPGVAAGCLIVFIMAIGFYVIPALLGGPRQTMITQIIFNEMTVSLNWPFGAALTSVLLAVTLAGFFVFVRFLGLQRLSLR